MNPQGVSHHTGLSRTRMPVPPLLQMLHVGLEPTATRLKVGCSDPSELMEHISSIKNTAYLIQDKRYVKSLFITGLLPDAKQFFAFFLSRMSAS